MRIGDIRTNISGMRMINLRRVKMSWGVCRYLVDTYFMEGKGDQEFSVYYNLDELKYKHRPANMSYKHSTSYLQRLCPISHPPCSIKTLKEWFLLFRDFSLMDKRFYTRPLKRKALAVIVVHKHRQKNWSDPFEHRNRFVERLLDDINLNTHDIRNAKGTIMWFHKMVPGAKESKKVYWVY